MASDYHGWGDGSGYSYIGGSGTGIGDGGGIGDGRCSATGGSHGSGYGYGWCNAAGLHDGYGDGDGLSGFGDDEEYGNGGGLITDIEYHAQPDDERTGLGYGEGCVSGFGTRYGASRYFIRRER